MTPRSWTNWRPTSGTRSTNSSRPATRPKRRSARRSSGSDAPTPGRRVRQTPAAPHLAAGARGVGRVCCRDRRCRGDGRPEGVGGKPRARGCNTHGCGDAGLRRDARGRVPGGVLPARPPGPRTRPRPGPLVAPRGRRLLDCGGGADRPGRGLRVLLPPPQARVDVGAGRARSAAWPSSRGTWLSSRTGAAPCAASPSPAWCWGSRVPPSSPSAGSPPRSPRGIPNRCRAGSPPSSLCSPRKRPSPAPRRPAGCLRPTPPE